MKRAVCFIIIFSLCCLLVFLSFSWLPQKIKVYLIGDSTMADKKVSAYPETGWGTPFAFFFDESVEVDNRALNGRSTKTFIAENLWQPVAEQLQEGDYVFIQFGHNDEVQTKKSYATADEFENNLKRFISETRRKKAIPVLLTPVARRKFDESGKIAGTHEEYAAIVRKVAATQNTHLIDLDRKSQELLQKMGVENSKLLFLHLQPGEHPNYPEGKEDDTHFSELGARKIAQLVLNNIEALQLELAGRIIKQEPQK